MDAPCVTQLVMALFVDWWVCTFFRIASARVVELAHFSLNFIFVFDLLMRLHVFFFAVRECFQN